MDWSLWEPWYLWIAGALNLSIAMDCAAAHKLNHMIRSVSTSINRMAEIFKDKIAIVIGAGPSIDEAISIIDDIHGVVLAADGACGKLLEMGLTPHVIITDLDGRIDDIYECWRRGSYVVVHAHGDNIKFLGDYIPKFNERIIGTTQARPIGCLHNFGGFTDGDRAVFMALELKCKAVLMIGMDLSRVVGRYSKPWLKADSPIWPFKQAKFIIARKLLSWASKLYRKPMARVVVNGYDFGDKINGVDEVNVKNIEDWLRRTQLSF